MRDGDENQKEPADFDDRREFHHDPIDHVAVWGGMTVGELASTYADAGIGADDLHEAVEIYAEMLRRDEVTNVFALAGAMVPAGMRRVVTDLVRDGHVDALVTTGANLTHDSIDAIGGSHHHGRESAVERTAREHDEMLREEGIDRIYDVYLPQEHFASFEDHLRSNVFPELSKRETVGIADLTRELGRANVAVNESAEIEADPGLAAAAYEQDVPVFCPSFQDSILGLQAWLYSRTSSFSVDALSDMTALNDIAIESESAGVMVVGGGVPKNFALQTFLVAPDAYDYAVQLTMDPPHTGGLSGASLDEARSWGKLSPDARNASVYGDATITLPIVIAAARERIE